MSDDTFSVNTEGLSEQLPYMQELARSVRAVGTNLQARIGPLEGCWGGDATGQQFFSQYDSPREQIVQGVGDVGDVLDSTTEGVQTMAVQFDRLEEENVAAVRQMSPRETTGPSAGDDYDGR